MVCGWDYRENYIANTEVPFVFHIVDIGVLAILPDTLIITLIIAAMNLKTICFCAQFKCVSFICYLSYTLIKFYYYYYYEQLKVVMLLFLLIVDEFFDDKFKTL